MARVPPNKPSKHRKTPKSASNRPRESPTPSGSSATRSEQHERRDEETRSTERPLTQTPENQDNGGRRLNVSASTSSSSTSTCSSTPSSSTLPTVAALIPRVPRSDRDSSNRCLKPLNLASALNRVDPSVETSNIPRIDDFMQRLKTLFENQNQFFEKHMERAQRRENPAPPASKRLPKELLVSHRSFKLTLTTRPQLFEGWIALSTG